MIFFKIAELFEDTIVFDEVLIIFEFVIPARIVF